MTVTMSRMIDHSLSTESERDHAGPGQVAITRLRAAGRSWNAIGWQHRLKIIGRIAGELADRGLGLANAVHRPAATLGEVMASEVLPLAEACRYAAKRGDQILKPKRLRQRDGVWWMGSITVTEVREPLGLVLIIGPSNYPLFLPGVQMIQALAAGNAVMIKPAPGCEAAMRELIAACTTAGVPADVMQLLDSNPQSAQDAIAAGVDKVLFTGSLTTGRRVAEACSARMTPVAMELSGNDAVMVGPDADLERVANCLSYALSLNGGQTCIAPRRVFATNAILQRLIPLLRERMAAAPARAITERGLQFARRLVDAALATGATIACGQLSHFDNAASVRPIVLANVQCDMALATEDIFAPVLSLIEVDEINDALGQASACSYALGASIFGKSQYYVDWAFSTPAGCITVNDILVPTADPRVSFGGRQASGYGVTRGLEGLRELTQLKVVCTRRGRWLPHLTTSDEQLAPMMQGILQLRHGRTWKQRWAGIQCLMKAGKKK
jgi:acyl-CoA reductase-like NAD-dependent aldehyde dehydrogenase